MSKKITKVRPKTEPKPKTVTEKLERLKTINPAGMAGLIKAFDLDVNL